MKHGRSGIGVIWGWRKRRGLSPAPLIYLLALSARLKPCPSVIALSETDWRFEKQIPPLRCGMTNKRLLQQRSVFGLGFGFFWGDYYCCGYFVLVFEVEEFYSAGGAAGGADGFGVDADDFAELAYDHELGGVVDEVDGGDFADLGCGLHADDAFAGSGLEAVLVDVGALAVAVFGDGEDEAGGEAELLV